MRKFLAIICAVALFMTGISEASAKNDGIKVTLNGNEIEFDVPPQIINNRTMVPLRAVFEAMGAMVVWDDYYYSDYRYISVVIHLNGKRIDFRMDNNRMDDNMMWINHQRVWLDSPPCIIDGRTLVPVRAISEALGADVNWNGMTKTVEIEYEQLSPFPVDAQKFSIVLDNAMFWAINYFEKETLTNKEFAKSFVTFWYDVNNDNERVYVHIPNILSDVNSDLWEVVGSIDELNSKYQLLFGCELPYLTEKDFPSGSPGHIYNGNFVAVPFRRDGDPTPATYNHSEKKSDGSYDLIFNYIDYDGTYFDCYDIFNISLSDNANGFIINSYRHYQNGVLQPLEY